jgi:hypothetical protein
MSPRRLDQTAAKRVLLLQKKIKKLLGSFSLLAKKHACSKKCIREKRYQFLRYPRSVTEFSPGKVLYQHVSTRSATESSLGDGIFFSTTTYGGTYVVVFMSLRLFVSLFVCLFFVCPRNYLNNVQDIIKVHFCQLRLVVSFNNILYT